MRLPGIVSSRRARRSFPSIGRGGSWRFRTRSAACSTLRDLRRGLMAASALAVTAVTGCVPRLAPLSGAPVPASRLPHTAVAPGHHKIVFNWELRDRDLDTRGEGVARIAAPDSARLDFFLGGGFGGGGAVLIRDSVQI